MIISSSNNLNSYISRYDNVAKHFPKKQDLQDQKTRFNGAMSLMAKNLSYLLDHNMKINFSELSKKSQTPQTAEPESASEKTKVAAISDHSQAVVCDSK